MGPGREVSGGSVANSCAGVASLGGKAAYVGRVASDQLGEVFVHDIKAAGVDFRAQPSGHSEPPTARCLILVTPDAQRTMNTFLGACVELTPDDIDPQAFVDAQVTYLEGYLWDPPQAKEAMLKAAQASKAAGRKVALTLSDPFCVDRHRDSFRELIASHIDILFANEAEILSLTQSSSFEEAAAAIRGRAETVVVTRSEKGSVIITKEDDIAVPAAAVAQVIDTTGAGDLFAAGFLFGYAQGKPLAECSRIGAIAAAEVISHYGARPEAPLKSLL
jgi:sugar/nucleoside kinase (ribokinase family)